MKSAINKISIILPAIAVIAAVFTGCQKSELVPLIADSANPATKKMISTPDVPAEIAVPAGNKVLYHCYASGVQIYQATESTTTPGQYVWTFVAPSATLYEKPNYTKQVGTHYAGPTWEATLGPKKNLFVVGTKLSSVTEDASAVPWLLLQAVPGTDPGNFLKITFIQRLYTTGGLAPATAPTADQLSMQVSIPYTAEYYFFGEK